MGNGGWGQNLTSCYRYRPQSHAATKTKDMKRIIHVNRHHIAANRKGDSKPVLSVKTYKSNTYGNSVKTSGPVELVYRPDKPLPCGAAVWIETQDPVVIDEQIRV